MAFIEGTNGDDDLAGTPGADQIVGGGGDDTLRGLGGNDLLEAATGIGGVDEGDDSLDGGAGDDTLVSGGGADVLIGGAGTDRLVTTEAWFGDGALDIDLTRAAQGGGTLTASGFEVLESFGTDFDDVLGGGRLADTLDGGFGDDTLRGRGGADRIEAFDGNDLIEGGAGDDRITVFVEDDTVRGGDGADTLEGGWDGTGGVIDAGGGADRVGVLAARVDGGVGTDVLVLTEEALGSGIIDLSVLSGGARAMVADADIGGFERVDVRLSDQGGAADRITGTTGADWLQTTTGEDTLIGGAGDDYLATRTSRGDRIDGGAGVDVLGIDWTPARTNGSVFTAEDLLNGAAVTGIESYDFGSQPSYAFSFALEGSTLDDRAGGGEADDMLEGLGGADTLFGLGGGDEIVGGAGDDLLYGDGLG